jgi:hypothetical protein
MRNLRHRRTLYARGISKGRLPCDVVERVMIVVREREERDRAQRVAFAAFSIAFSDLPPPTATARAAQVAIRGLDYDRRFFWMPAQVRPLDTLDPFST